MALRQTPRNAAASPGTSARIAFVVGAQKTGTSTVNGLLNCARNALILYEVELQRFGPSKYGHELVDAWPEARPLIGPAVDIVGRYREFADALVDAGHRYDVVGDKFVSIDPAILNRLHPAKVIVTGRRFSTWCCKRQTIVNYRTDIDIVPAARDFLRFWTEAGTREHVHRFRLEDLFADTARACRTLLGFVGLADSRVEDEAWWEVVGKWRDDELKQRILRWPDLHPSSRRPPAALDTSSERNEHPFWDAVRPILDHYDRTAAPLTTAEAAEHLGIISSLHRFSPLPLFEAFREIDSLSAIRELKPVTLAVSQPA